MDEMNNTNIREARIEQCEKFNTYSSSISYEGMLILELLRFKQSEWSLEDLKNANEDLAKLSDEDFDKLLQGLKEENTIIETENGKYKFSEYPTVPFLEDIKEKDFYEPLFARKDMNVDNWQKVQNTFFKRVVEKRREKMSPNYSETKEKEEKAPNIVDELQKTLSKVKTNQNQYFDLDAPVRLVESTIYLNQETDKNQLELCIRNVSDDKIKSITVDVTALNEKMREVASVKGYEIKKLNASPKALFGTGKFIDLDTDKAHDVRVTISKVEFKDSKEWVKPENAVETFVLTPTEKHENEILLGAIKENLDIISTYEYDEKSDYWMCSCGAPNKADATECILCSAKKKDFEKLQDKDYIKEIVENYKDKEIVSRAKENSRYAKKAQKSALKKIDELKIEIDEAEKKRIKEHKDSIYDTNTNINSVHTVEGCKKAIEALNEIKDYKDAKKFIADYEAKIEKLNADAAEAARLKKEKKAKKRKKALIVVIIVIAVLAALAGLYFLWQYVLNPQLRYDDAVKLRKSGKYDEAITAFENMHGYKDSETQIKATLFDKAVSYMNEKDYDFAIKLLEEIEDYDGASDKILECKYNKAVEVKDAKEYEDAIKLFEELGKYGDSEEQINYCRYQLANELFVDEKYQEAADAFKELGDYEDAEDRYNESLYKYLRTFTDSRKQKETLEKLPKDYKDVAERLQKLEAFEKTAKKWEGTWKGYIQSKGSLEWKRTIVKITTNIERYSLYYSVKLNDGKTYKGRLKNKIHFNGYTLEKTNDGKKLHITKGGTLSPSYEGWLTR
jgi:TolA-binding protein